ncbi:hypothetical protein LTR99_001436 [Exophiala xenobiotica]|uniref:F-box domain-containing protein n=1 Tax=Vermiconidia calcicola TaxID=1690605 RepID=A0AAV9QIR3_9PEZI|nr:hypothetical protein LTR99_001436 [Exophiala xenobiotica]KAK5543946.1 hypothetical protein LTR25_001561 [Vermiconidia calcicola]KAK5549743.1 hypothetical protein LTR23_000033 [Chaetothyriales sp. CCFEE 6169]
MTNPPTPPNKRLFGLPPELNDQIISKLNYEDLRSLRATCHSASVDSLDYTQNPPPAYQGQTSRRGGDRLQAAGNQVW